MAATSDAPRYRELSTLGVGGMARVTLAEDTLLGRRVALKRLPTGADSQGLARLRREALIGASISHPNVVSIYDVLAEADGEIVIVMEYVAGETLRQRLGRQGRLGPAETRKILQAVAAGLDAIHTGGIVHRDVKPANILLGTDGSVKLADLGIASATDQTRITVAGTVIGSFGYMAPEQIEGGPAAPAIDVYALGAVAFEALSGRKARPETNPVAAAHAIVAGPPADLLRAWPAAPIEAAAVIARAMARRPEDRQGSAGEFVRELHTALERQPSAPPLRPVLAAPGAAPTAPTRRLATPASRRAASLSWLLAPLALAAVVLAIVAALLSTGGPAHAGRAAARRPVTAHPPPSTTAASTTAVTPPVTNPAPPPTGPGEPPGHRKHDHHGKHDH